MAAPLAYADASGYVNLGSGHRADALGGGGGGGGGGDASTEVPEGSHVLAAHELEGHAPLTVQHHE